MVSSSNDHNYTTKSFGPFPKKLCMNGAGRVWVGWGRWDGVWWSRARDRSVPYSRWHLSQYAPPLNQLLWWSARKGRPCQSLAQAVHGVGWNLVIGWLVGCWCDYGVFEGYGLNGWLIDREESIVSKWCWYGEGGVAGWGYYADLMGRWVRGLWVSVSIVRINLANHHHFHHQRTPTHLLIFCPALPPPHFPPPEIQPKSILISISSINSHHSPNSEFSQPQSSSTSAFNSKKHSSTRAPAVKCSIKSITY